MYIDWLTIVAIIIFIIIIGVCAIVYKLIKRNNERIAEMTAEKIIEKLRKIRFERKNILKVGAVRGINTSY